MPSDAQQVWPFPQKHPQEGEMRIYIFDEGKKRNNKKKRKKGGGEEEMNICLERRIKGTRIKLHGKFTLLFDKRKEYVE